MEVLNDAVNQNDLNITLAKLSLILLRLLFLDVLQI